MTQEQKYNFGIPEDFLIKSIESVKRLEKEHPDVYFFESKIESCECICLLKYIDRYKVMLGEKKEEKELSFDPLEYLYAMSALKDYKSKSIK
jgi:hypothetical protein